jgi:hypothetical protein
MFSHTTLFNRSSLSYLDMSYETYSPSKPEHPQLIFIHGFGTTSLVHALAEEHNFKVRIK